VRKLQFTRTCQETSNKDFVTFAAQKDRIASKVNVASNNATKVSSLAMFTPFYELPPIVYDFNSTTVKTILTLRVSSPFFLVLNFLN
jgi:hypothetical protein